MRYLILFIAISAFLAGCSTTTRHGEPAPIISRDGNVSQPTSSAEESGVVVTPLQVPTAPTAKPATNRAVELLHERAQQQIDDGELAAAAKSLERALSIQPDNARSWNLLAHLRAMQQQYSMASEIAAKSNSLASTDQVALKKDNLMLMSKMKSMLGDQASANRLKQQAMLLN